MRDIIDMIDQWREQGQGVALATVVRTFGSSPRVVGAKMAVSSTGAMVGSVSGGCIEGAVFEACQEAMKTGQARLLHFGVADEDAWEVGLACGGMIDVFVEAIVSSELRDALKAEHPIVSATVMSGPAQVGAKLLLTPDSSTYGSLDAKLPEPQIVAEMLAMLLRAESGIRSYATPEGEVELFIESFPPTPNMFIVGAVHIAIALVTFAKALGYRTVVVDARAAFATPERFSHADELVIAWPDEALAGRLNSSSAVVLLTHDPKLDDPAILAALDSPAAYIGALGSPSTHAKRLERLRQAGISEEQLTRLHAPVGLKIGARTPEEIAVSIIAEVVASRRRK